jgi:hypothetical protein
MKRIGCLPILVVLGVAFSAVFLWLAIPSAAYRYRLTVEIATPTGVKSAFAVHHVEWRYGEFGDRFDGKLRGEAIFIDLGAGVDGRLRNAVALLPSIELVPDAFDRRYERHEFQKYAAIKDVVDLKGSFLPAVIALTDIRDPTSARVLRTTEYRQQCREDRKPGCVPENIAITVDAFTDVLGPGYSFRRATVEMVAAGRWPFNLWNTSTLQWLFGESVTLEIDAKLPFLTTHRDELWKAGIRTLSGLELNTFSFKRLGAGI